MIRSRLTLLLALALLVPACKKEGDTIIYQVVDPVPEAPAEFPIVVESGLASGGSAEGGGQGEVGGDGLVRTVAVLTTNGLQQIRFTRRNADGTFTDVLAVSASDADPKTEVEVFVTSNNFTHIFWLEGSPVTQQLHYAQVNDASAPALTVTDTIISAGPTANVGISATYNRVLTYTTAIDRASDHIYAMWIQEIGDPGTEDVPVVGAILAGTGVFQERFALAPPSAPGGSTDCILPVLKVAADGRVHAAWAAAFDLRHRQRTGPGAWSSGPTGDIVSSAASNPFKALNLVTAPDGDAYITLVSPTDTLRAAYRPAGDASVFAADVAPPLAPSTKLVTVLESGTEALHIFVGNLGASTAEVRTVRNPAANLAGAWEFETVHSIVGTVVAPTAFEAWSDSGDRVVVAMQMPAVTQGFPRILARTRPSGPGNGNFTATADLTASGALPCASLTLAANASGEAILAWSQGASHGVPVGEIHGALYAPGGAWTATFNLSQTPALASHGPIFAAMTETGAACVSWLESVSAGPDTHQVYFALRP